MDTTIFTVSGPRPGQVVHFIHDGAVRRGRVLSLEAELTFRDCPEDVQALVWVGWRDDEGEKCRAKVPAFWVFEGAVEACNEAFGNEPEPEL